MITRLIISLATAIVLTPIVSASAQEHPEHPQNKVSSTEKKITAAAISSGIKKHIENETAKSRDRKFHLNYEGKDLALDLIRVHDDRLSALGQGRYFACVDMKAANGTIYDIDFFLSGEPSGMTVTDTSVHKVNGKPRYNWKEDNGVWKKVSA